MPVEITPDPLRLEIKTFPPRVLISMPLWLHWAAIAVEQEKRAAHARVELEQCEADEESTFVIDELRASMVAVTAAAHAIEGLALGLQRYVGRRRGTTLLKRIINTFEPLTDASPQVQSRLRALFVELRNQAVHPSEELRETVPHPSDRVQSSVAAEQAKYTVEAAREAVDLMLELADIASARSLIEPARRQNWQSQLIRLRQMRESS